MLIKYENFSNKNVINFYLPFVLIEEGKVAVADNKSGAKENFLNNILQISGVKRCLVASDLLSVQYETENFSDVKSLVMAEIDDYSENFEKIRKYENAVDMKTIAEALADAFIRPTLNRDNGDVDILNVDETKLELKFTGHCAGCPYAQNTLQNVVVRVFQKYFPQLEVVLKE